MAKIANTIQQVRDRILQTAGVENSTEWEGIVLYLLNQAAMWIHAFHNWRFLQEKATITFTDATGIITLPEDCAEILSLSKSGGTYKVIEKHPSRFQDIKDSGQFNEPAFFCYVGTTQASSTVAPSINIEVIAAPAAGAEMTLWYKRHIDEMTTADLATVPNIPIYLWDMIAKKAELDALREQKNPPSFVEIEAKILESTLMNYKQRETVGGAQLDCIPHHPGVSNYLARRGKVVT